jgi:hypothetical protein
MSVWDCGRQPGLRGVHACAQAARSIGSTLRAFQPTIKEVVEVSQDIKGTLEKELGLDELREAARPAAPPRTTPSPNTMEDLLRAKTSVGGFGAVDAASMNDEDPDIEAKRAASAAAAWGTPAASGEPASATASAPAAPAPAAQPAPAAAAAPLGDLSTDALEAELARRRAAAAPSSSQPAKSQ